jgi:LmbE family N-acetylglucosaminyl deacetylase
MIESTPGNARFWAQWAGALPRWSPPLRPLLIVAPHPDDETLGAGGLLSAWAARGLPATVLSLSDGERACPEVPGLAEIRHAELTRALRALGFYPDQPHMVRLSLPDGELGAYEQRIADRIRELLHPESLLVAPFELDGHPDHDAAGRAALIAARTRNATLVRYPIWAWLWQASQLRAAERRAVRFELTSNDWAAKQHAIDQFQSQLHERPGGAIIPAHVRNHFALTDEVFLL